LLKGCERRFRPVHPLTRYCSPECRAAARRWREWKARHRYRQSEAGKQKRQAQSRRYRMRRQQAGEAQPAPGKPGEGHRKKNYFVPPVIVRAAMRSWRVADARRCSDFAHGRVDEPWSGFGSANAAGGNGRRSGASPGPELGVCDSTGENSPEMVLRYCASSAGVNKFKPAPANEEGGTEPSQSGASHLGLVLRSFFFNVKWFS
jgi:hypothetical protein